MGDGVRESGFFEMTSALGGPTGTTVIVKEPTERRLWDARAIVAKRSGGVMKNRQVKVTKVTIWELGQPAGLSNPDCARSRSCEPDGESKIKLRTANGRLPG